MLTLDTPSPETIDRKPAIGSCVPGWRPCRRGERAMESRASLLGLNAPTVVKTEEIGEVAEAKASLLAE